MYNKILHQQLNVTTLFVSGGENIVSGGENQFHLAVLAIVFPLP
jgi:hypothetical protein